MVRAVTGCPSSDSTLAQASVLLLVTSFVAGA
jgi:hypothetical protein